MIDAQNVTAQAWVDITIKVLKKEIVKKRIGRYKNNRNSSRKSRKETTKLINSIEGSVKINSNGSFSSAMLSYNYYGMFVDMGVGRGTKLANVGQNKTDKRDLQLKKGQIRQRKVWYSRAIGKQVVRLASILAEKYGISAENIVLNEMPVNVNIKI